METQKRKEIQENQTVILDNTKRNCFQSCPRKFYWQFIRNLRSPAGSSALRYGYTWHGALEGYYRHIQLHGWQDSVGAITSAAGEAAKVWKEETSKFDFFYPDYRSLENCLLSFTEYLGHYSQDPSYMEIEEVEKIFKLKINSHLYFTGKIDGVVKLNGRRWLLEHKTTSQGLSIQLARIQRDAQVIGYSFAGTLMFDEPVDGIMVSTHHLSAYKSKKTEQWGAPKIEFERRPQIFTDGDFSSWKESFLYTANKVGEAIAYNHFPMQFDSCYHFGRCSYTDLCEQNAPLDETNTQGYITVEPWQVENT